MASTTTYHPLNKLYILKIHLWQEQKEEEEKEVEEPFVEHLLSVKYYNNDIPWTVSFNSLNSPMTKGRL